MSLGYRKTIDILGFFDGGSSIEKEFVIPPGTSQLDLSFSLVRSEWIPLSDFLMVEIAT